MTTYKIDHEAKTILAIDKNGEHHDLNAEGEPCRTTADLTDFIRELCEQGFFSPAVRDELVVCVTPRQPQETTMTIEIKYEVLEDNGGGLHLYVYDGDRVIYSHSGYEYCPGQLTEDIAALLRDGSVDEWDGCGDNPQAERDEWDRFEHGSDLIADQDGVYGDRMGAAGQLEFGDGQ